MVDLAAIDVLRDRERGVPRYNAFRRGLQLKPLTAFEDLTPDEDVVKALQSVYSDVEEIDLHVGLMAEACRPKNFAISESAFQVFILIASQRLASDGFFTDKWTPEVYTAWGLRHVETTSFKSLVSRHYPELAGHIAPNNAFQPWRPEQCDACSPNAWCQQAPGPFFSGGYTCACKQGFVGDGQTCAPEEDNAGVTGTVALSAGLVFVLFGGGLMLRRKDVIGRFSDATRRITATQTSEGAHV